MVKNSDFVIQTQNDSWVIPKNTELLKLLLVKQNIKASDLTFDSEQHYQGFTKNLFLMALKDEYSTNQPSILAQLGRQLMSIKQQNTYSSHA